MFQCHLELLAGHVNGVWSRRHGDSGWVSPARVEASCSRFSLVKHGVLVRLDMGWFRGLVTRKSRERTKLRFVRLWYIVWPWRGPKRVGLEASVRSIQHGIKRRSGGCVGFATTKRGKADGGCGQNSNLGGSADGRNPAVSSGGRSLTPNVRNVDHVL